ncbi:MAG: type I restriction-modification system subunit M [Butyricicoccus sp.]
MNKQQLAQKIWASANQMRSKIEANEYKDYILGFIFYKYLSDKEVKFLKENDYDDELLKTVSEEDDETVKWVQENIGYFISYKDLFSTWLSMGKDFDVSNVRDALSAFSRLISNTHKKVFEKVFDTLQTGLSKLGDSSGSQTKAISGLLTLIKDIPMDGKQDYDVLGFIYEYLISNFAANAGKKAGEFYTPHEVSLLMSEIVASHLKGKSEIKIYDPTSGSGSLLINIGQSVAKYMSDENNIKYFAQELKENTYNLTRMNLVMRGIDPANIVTRNGDTLEEDWPYFDENDPINTYDPLYVDAVVSNPPYSQAWDPTNKEGDPRYARFGLAPKGKADYAFLLHDLFHLKPDGIMTIVLPHGVLFRGGEEGEIRKNLIENNHIDAIIGLPANIFFGTGIPTIIMVLRQKRENTDVLIIDASKGFIKEGKNNKLRASDIKRIADTFIKRENVPKYARVVSREEIRSNDYNLNIPRYVDSSEAAEHWDVYASMFGGIPMAEIDEMGEFWTAFPALKKALFTETGTSYVNAAVSDIKSAIKSHPDVVGFEDAFHAAFTTFPAFLKEELIDQMENVEISKAETVLSTDVFARLKAIPLIDKYAAFQLLDDDWTGISIDLEVLQTEGFSATKKVDPNLVIKKKDGKEQEVQDGWVGHIIPFELVQATLLSKEADELHGLESRLAEIPSEYEAILDELSEDEKESCKDALNDEGDAFVPKEVTKMIKELKKDRSAESAALRSILEKVDTLTKSEKTIKAQIKAKGAELQTKTKDTIEHLSDKQALELLEKKWIVPLVESIYKLPDTVIDSLVSKIQALQSKYATTFFEVEQQISETEATLAGMIDELEGKEYDMLGLSELKKLLGGSAE